MRVHSFPAIADRKASRLILGTMPGKASLRAGQYYAHERNAFWSIIAALFGVPATAPYAERGAQLRAQGIALWDVLQSCSRESSLDADTWEECYQSREDPDPNPEMRLLQQESFKQLETALAQLSCQQRQCLILRAQGFRHEEVAKILRITSSNVAQSLRRGIKKLAELNHE